MNEEKRKFTQEDIEYLEEITGHKVTEEELENLSGEDLANIESILEERNTNEEKPQKHTPSIEIGGRAGLIITIFNAIRNLFKKK